MKLEMTELEMEKLRSKADHHSNIGIISWWLGIGIIALGSFILGLTEYAILMIIMGIIMTIISIINIYSWYEKRKIINEALKTKYPKEFEIFNRYLWKNKQ